MNRLMIKLLVQTRELSPEQKDYVVEANSTYFYIRAQRCENLYDQIGEITRWETVTIGMK